MSVQEQTTAEITVEDPPFGTPYVLALAVVRGPDQNAIHRIASEQITVGVSEEADFVLSDRQVSSRHLEIRVSGSLFSLSDLRSTNGTVLNFNRIEPGKPVRLKHLDEIQIGKTRMLFMACRFRTDPARAQAGLDTP